MKHLAPRWLALALNGALVLGARSADFTFPGQTFSLPDGFTVERVAGPPLVDRPIMADFDELGRLYVSDSSGSNDKVEKQLAEKPHRILRLVDVDGDGRFDRSTVFADKMMFPEGCLWFRGSLYVSAPPSIWKLTDTDGDGVTDQREEWLPAQTLTGCANDLHGPYLGLDGWLYWCKGAFAKQTYERPGRSPFVTRAAHIFRARPDGSGIEPVLTGGMDNPVSVAFTPGGERILTGTFFVHPGGGQRDGLIHAIYGGVYGKDHDVISGHPRTGELMPIMTHHGPSASCAVIRYESAAFGPEYRDNLFTCLFNLHKVTRHVLVPEGATFKTRDEDFLVSDNPDFHPTHLLEDADGSLLVVDTGGWYKICCPTSQLWKPDVLGAIYRVRRTAAPKPSDPRGLQFHWPNAAPAALASFLGDPRVAVRQRAMEELARRPSAAVPVLSSLLRTSPDAEVRRHAVWTLTRIESEGARQAVRAGLQDSDPIVRQAAIHSIASWRDRAAAPDLIPFLAGENAHLQRAAAEALGRMGETKSVTPILQAAVANPDRVLEHSLIYALIETGERDALQRALAQPGTPPQAQRAALIALDQMEGGGLRPEQITALLDSRVPILKQTAAWIVRHHPEWAGALAGYFRERLASNLLPGEERGLLEQQLAGFAKDAAIQSLLVEVLQDRTAASQARLSALQAMARSNLKEAPVSWTEALVRVLRSGDQRLVAAAVTTARALSPGRSNSGPLSASLQEIGRDSAREAALRLEALAAAPVLSALEPDTFDFVRGHLDPARPVLARGMAAGILAKAPLPEDQLLAVAESIRTAGPLELPKLLAVFEKCSIPAIGLKLIASLEESAALPGLRPDMLRPRLTNFPEVVRRESEQLLARINVDADQQKAHLDDLLNSMKQGDIRRGQAVFNSQKAACSTCHAIGYLGGDVGPDLTRIGQIRTERDLLEAIAYPSASFVRSYEPVVVTTKDGDDHLGVVRKDAPDELVLATGPGAEVRLARAQIADLRAGTVSIMPGGLEEQLTRQELADLIAFLKATRW